MLYYRKRMKQNTPIDISVIGVDQSTEDLVKSFEGEELTVYKDTAGYDTVGVGHKVLDTDNLSFGDTIEKEKSLELFKGDSATAAGDIKTHITQPLTQDQFNALISLVFNIGVGHFNSSTVLREINMYDLQKLTSAQKDELRSAWLAWKNAGGQPVLLSRRQKEADIFLA